MKGCAIIVKITITNQKIYRRSIGLPGYTTITIDPVQTVTFEDKTLANREFYDRLASQSNGLKVLINQVVANADEVVPALPPYVDKAPVGWEDTDPDNGGTPQVSGNFVPSDSEGKALSGVAKIPYTAAADSQVDAPSVAGYTPVSAKVSIPTKGGDIVVKYTANVVNVSSVTLDKTTYSGNTGDTLQLNATVLPSNATNKSVTYKSSDISTATVTDAGKVTFVKAGKVTITATTTDGGKTATSTITITDPVVPVKEVTADSSLTVKMGQTAKINAVVSPSNATDKSVTYSSADPSIYTVATDGTINPVKAGGPVLATVTSHADPLKKATVPVTITDK